MKTLLLTQMEKHWACSVYVLDLRLLREEERQGTTASELDCSAWSCICLDGHDRTAAGLCWCLGGITACCGKGTDILFFPPYFFSARNVARTEKLLVREGASLQHYLPSHHLSTPSSCLRTPALRWMGGEKHSRE